MPRRMTEILDQADELAAKLEAYEPSSDDEIEIEEFLRRRRKGRSVGTTRPPSPGGGTGAIEGGS